MTDNYKRKIFCCSLCTLFLTMTLSLSSRPLSPGTTIDNGDDTLLEKSPKKFRSTNTWLETKKIQNALEEKKALLEEKRVEKLAQLSQGEWIPSSHLVKVTKQVGRHWGTMGHNYMGDLYLDPEEALFLLEANTIEIYFNGVPMSLQQAYSVLLGSESGCTLEEYRAYAHLTRFGYRVRRHRPEVGRKRKREEALEIDVVGVIRRRKSHEAEGSENLVEVEDAVEVVDSAKMNANCSVKDLQITAQHLPSTSQTNNTTDDDDIKFLEIVDTSKRRKVLSSVVIHDEAELSLANSNSKENACSGQSYKCENDDERRKGSKSCISETEKMPGNSIHSGSDCELELVDNCNDKGRPSRGMYKSSPFASEAADTLEKVSSKDIPSTSRNNHRTKAKSGSRNEKGSASKVTETNDDVIVLSDDETKQEDKQAKELLKFYKEISLIELIDISGEDEEGKAACNVSGDGSKKVGENFDFWGVLGRIPIIENGRLILKIPAPPPQLIPLNIRLFRDEYVVIVSASLQRPCDSGNPTSNQVTGEFRGHEGEGASGERDGGGSSSRGGGSNCGMPQGVHRHNGSEMRSQSGNRQMEMNSYLLPTPQAPHVQGIHSQQWQQPYAKNHWNPWLAWGHQAPSTNYYSNPRMAMNCWNSQYQASSSRSLWSSLVYSERQVNSHPIPNVSQQWAPSSIPQFHHSAQQMNFRNCGQNLTNQYWSGNRYNQWQSSSGYSYGPRGGGRWQRWRKGSRHYGRGGRCLQPSNRRPNTQGGSAREDIFAPSVVPKVPHARNWLELKIKCEKTNPSESTVEPKPEVSKDTKDILPLLKPADSINIDAVQSKLQITSCGKDNYYNNPENYTSSMAIKFDLYMPNTNFRKSSPGLPKYRLSIVKSEDKIPKLKDMWYMTKDLNDEVPLLFAVSFTENVNFFSFSDVNLPAPLSQ